MVMPWGRVKTPSPQEPQEAPVAVVDDHRVLAAVDDVDPVLGVGRHPGHVAVAPAGRELLPPLDQAVLDRLLTPRHVAPLLSRPRWGYEMVPHRRCRRPATIGRGPYAVRHGNHRRRAGGRPLHPAGSPHPDRHPHRPGPRVRPRLGGGRRRGGGAGLHLRGDRRRAPGARRRPGVSAPAAGGRGPRPDRAPLGGDVPGQPADRPAGRPAAGHLGGGHRPVGPAGQGGRAPPLPAPGGAPRRGRLLRQRGLLPRRRGPVAAVAAEMERYVGLGFRDAKIKVGGRRWRWTWPGCAPPGRCSARPGAWPWTPTTPTAPSPRPCARRRAFEPFDPWWFEEPLSPDATAGHAALARRLDVAAGHRGDPPDALGVPRPPGAPGGGHPPAGRRGAGGRLGVAQGGTGRAGVRRPRGAALARRPARAPRGRSPQLPHRGVVPPRGGHLQLRAPPGRAPAAPRRDARPPPAPGARPHPGRGRRRPLHPSPDGAPPALRPSGCHVSPGGATGGA